MRRLARLPLEIVIVLLQSMWLALGQIWTNKTRSVLTTIGIVIGVASVTAVIATLTGFKTKMLDTFESLGTNKLIIRHERPSTGPLSNASWWSLRFLPEHFDGLMKHCPSVKHFSRQAWQGWKTVRYGEKTVARVATYGIDPSWSKIDTRGMVLGRPISELDWGQQRRVCVIDPGLQEDLQLDRDCIGESIFVGDGAFRIIGIFEQRPQMSLGNSDRSYSEVYFPLPRDSKVRNQSTWALASSKTTDVSEEAQAEIRFFLRRTRKIKPGQPDTFRVWSIKSEVEKFKEISVNITLVAGGIVGISLLVGGIGIMNIMLVSVSERTREIGLRKAVGARSSAIMIQFLVEAIVLCFIGGLVGVGLGQILTMIISNLNPAMAKAYIPAWAIVLAFGFAGTVGICFGMFPAVKAARLDPIEALRHE